MFRGFEENGDHVPRILPCSHTLCHECIGQMIRQNRIECPECREKHEFKKEIRETFPQNKYILANIRRRLAANQKEVSTKDTCEKHGKDHILYCKESGCMKPICAKCITKYHSGHQVLDIDEQKEILLKEIDSLKESLVKNKNIILDAKKENEKKSVSCVAKLRKTKEEIIKQLDKMIKDVQDQRKVVDSTIGDEISVINENVILLNKGNKRKRSTATIWNEDIYTPGLPRRWKLRTEIEGYHCIEKTNN